MSESNRIVVEAGVDSQGPHVTITYGLSSPEREMLVRHWNGAWLPRQDTPAGTTTNAKIERGRVRLGFSEFTSPGAMVGFVWAWLYCAFPEVRLPINPYV